MSAKRFGYHADQLHFHMRNSKKYDYFHHKNYGLFSTSKVTKGQNLNQIIDNHKKKREYEKYLNPKGLRPSITSSFPKQGDTHDFVSHNILLYKSFKHYEKNVASFRCPVHLTKPEIQQYLMKVYGMNVLNVNTVVKQGRVVKNSDRPTRFKKKDWKKAIVEFDFDVEPSLAKHDL
mmetsp:Transcript_10434/g.9216  ORF Transcript_10434/g.9216 Transcript_10434/m.9216 type:complete len:176 (+) Transcript_10434:42-569(+)